VPEPARTAGWRGEVARGGRPFARAARCELGARGVTTSPGLRRPSLGDDVAAWLLSYGAVLEAAIATATLPPPRSTLPRRAGGGGGGARLVDTTETLRVAGPLRRPRCGALRRIRQRPARRGPGGA